MNRRKTKAEDQLRLVIDTIPSMAWSLGPDGIVDFVNQRWVDYTGLSLEEELAEPTRPIHPDDLPRVIKKWMADIAAGEPCEDEMRLRRADGKYRWFLVRAAPLRDKQGKVVKWFGISIDIEDRRQFEVALNAQARRYKTLMETSTDSIYVLDAKGNLQEANAAFLHRLGYTAAEGKELNVADWAVQGSREQLEERRRKRAGKSNLFETRHRCKDGSIFDVEVCATSVQIGGEELLFCVTRDITERKQTEDRLRRSEEKFKTLFGLAPVGIAFLDSRLNLVDCNPALERMSRLSREELLGQAWQKRTFLNADGTPRLPGERVSERAVSEKLPVNGVETGALLDNGEIVWAEVSVAPLALPDAKAVVIMHDITERKDAARELEAANHQLRALSRQLFRLQEEERRHLARELHDEIGQNLTAAKMNLEMISSQVPAKVAGRLEDSVQLLEQLLTQVRQLSLALRPALLDELGLVATLRWLLEQQAQRAGLRTQFHAPEPWKNLPPQIRTVGFRIAQEAITNVLRHAKAESVSVHLEIEGGQFRMKIVDDGKGFEIAEVQRRAHEGMGFGLMGMRERAALVGGRVRVTSSPDKGTSVEVSLPLNGSGEGRTG